MAETIELPAQTPISRYEGLSIAERRLLRKWRKVVPDIPGRERMEGGREDWWREAFCRLERTAVMYGWVGTDCGSIFILDSCSEK